MPLVKSVSVKITADGVADAKLKIDRVAVAAEKLKDLNPEITPKIDSAKALLQARLLREGIKAELSKGITPDAGGGGGLLARLFGGAGGGAAGVAPAAAPLAAPLATTGGVIAASVAGVGAALSGAGGIIPMLAAATAGVAAFGALALPTFTRITAAAGLTGDRLRDLPAGMRNAALGVQSLQSEFGKLALQLRPITLTIADTGLQIANKLLPMMLPFAKAAGTAIEGLLKQFDKFASSPGFKAFMANMLKMVGPTITTIGEGIGRVAVAVGKLMVALENPNAIRVLRGIFDLVEWIIQGIAKTFTVVTPIVIRSYADIATATRNTVHGIAVAWDTLEKGILRSVGVIIDGLSRAFGFLPLIGPKLNAAASAFNTFEGQVLSGLGSIQGSAANTAATLANVGVAALNAFSTSSAALGGIPGVKKNLPHKAAGGWASGLTLVGEMGPELIQVPAGSYVYNNQQSRGMLGGGNHYTIIQNVPPNADKRELGRVTVEAIRAFERGSGASWRKK